MGEIRLSVKAETLAGLCGELSKKQIDFENYAEGLLGEAWKKNGNKPVKFKKTDLRDKNYEIALEADTFFIDGVFLDLPAFEESEDGGQYFGLQDIHNDSIVELVKNITEAVEKGEEA